MRFRTRAFLCCFLPFAALLGGSFWMIQKLVQTTVSDGLRNSLLENEKAIERVHSRSELQSSRFLKVVGENSALKAGMQLLLFASDNPEARTTVEDQLRELCVRMGFDVLMVSGPSGTQMAGVIRSNGVVRPLELSDQKPGKGGLMMLNGSVYQIASVPIDQADENLGTLSVGEVFDFSEFTTPTVLLHNGHVMRSSISRITPSQIEAAMSHCGNSNECNVELSGVRYISLPMLSISFGDGYTLRSLQNLDSAVGPVQNVLHGLFATVAIAALLIAFIVSVASAGSIVRPIGTLVAHLKEAEQTGQLPELEANSSAVREIRGLIQSFNRAATAIREARANLTLAYVEFVESLASALDARDRYTAGHSKRVSELSRSLAAAMHLPPEEVERVRVGALLHDIGKIGIADTVLQKPGRLTPEEFTLIRQHPEIGRHILEGVNGFAAYLDAVELHHEDWDGTGYPHGFKGQTTPLDARIIHVADAYDAMTTDRPYRRGMTHQEALSNIQENAGRQFDPDVVRCFTELTPQTEQSNEPSLAETGA